MAVTLLEPPITDWYCAAGCGATDQTRIAGPHDRFHICPRRRFLTVPMYRKGTAAKVELRERDDYVGRDIVQLDPELGRPVMSLVTTRDEGQDTMVFAPTATATLT
jgi:hypothetical protein